MAKTTTEKQKTFSAQITQELRSIKVGDFAKEYEKIPSFKDFPAPIDIIGPMSARLKVLAIFLKRAEEACDHARSVSESMERASRAAGDHAHVIAEHCTKAKKDFRAAFARAKIADAHFCGQVAVEYPDETRDGYLMSPDGMLGVLAENPIGGRRSFLEEGIDFGDFMNILMRGGPGRGGVVLRRPMPFEGQHSHSLADG